MNLITISIKNMPPVQSSYLSLSSLFYSLKNSLRDNFVSSPENIAATYTTTTSSAAKQTVKDILFALEQSRHHSSMPIDYSNALPQLRSALATSNINNQAITDALIELAAHFPYIMSAPTEVRDILWELLSENMDKVQEGSKGYLWTHIAIYLEIFFFDKELHIASNATHPLYAQLCEKNWTILQYINSLLEKKDSARSPEKNKIQIDAESNILMQTLGYLKCEHHPSSMERQISGMRKKIVALISKSNLAIGYASNELVQSFHSVSSSAQPKPWIRALHFYRACSVAGDNLTPQRKALAKLIGHNQQIPKHLLRPWLEEIKPDIAILGCDIINRLLLEIVQSQSRVETLDYSWGHHAIPLPPTIFF